MAVRRMDVVPAPGTIRVLAGGQRSVSSVKNGITVWEGDASVSAVTAGTGGIKTIEGHRMRDGCFVFTITGQLQAPMDRTTAPNYNRKGNSGRQAGLEEYEKAHLWGPGFGDEAADGLMFAPKEVNQEWQNRNIEKTLRQLQKNAPPGSFVAVTATATSHPQGTPPADKELLLAESQYSFELVHPDGRREFVAEVTISVPPPQPDGSFTGKVTVEIDAGEAWERAYDEVAEDDEDDPTFQDEPSDKLDDALAHLGEDGQEQPDERTVDGD